jgi:hypothetical protein
MAIYNSYQKSVLLGGAVGLVALVAQTADQFSNTTRQLSDLEISQGVAPTVQMARSTIQSYNKPYELLTGFGELLASVDYIANNTKES